MPETKVAVFDLNQTLYKKSSKDEFFLFISKHKNYKILRILEQLFYKLLKQFNIISKTEFKENFFNYLNNIPPEKVKMYAKKFWEIEFPDNFHPQLLERIKELQRQDVKVYIITGAHEIYVEPLHEHLNVDGIIGNKTIYKDRTYIVKGKACKDEEKIKRLEQEIGSNYRLIESYSDSEEAILDLAEKAFLMKGEEIVPYNKK